jgi:hypothetical protein
MWGKSFGKGRVREVSWEWSQKIVQAVTLLAGHGRFLEAAMNFQLSRCRHAGASTLGRAALRLFLPRPRGCEQNRL